MATTRPLDAVIFGATGDTGSAAVRLLYHQAASVGVETWAPAARNLQKLQADVLDPLRAAAEGGERWTELIQADVDDLESLIKMCEKTKVVIACAGPYEHYGEAVIAACIRGGSHYVDVVSTTVCGVTLQIAVTCVSIADGRGGLGKCHAQEVQQRREGQGGFDCEFLRL